MGFFSSDMESMIDIYQRETVELMEEYDSRLLEAERRGGFSDEDVNSIFRVVHTIKSSSAMMGMDDMMKYAHKMEDIFSILRSHSEKLTSDETRLFRVLYSCSDYIKSEINRITEDNFKPTASQELIKDADELLKIIKCESVDALSAQAEPDTEVRQSISAEGENVLSWSVIFTEQCQMENVRAFMLVRQITPLCERISTIPSDLEKEDAAVQIKQQGLIINFASAQSDQIHSQLLASPYVDHIQDITVVAEEPPLDLAAEETSGSREETPASAAPRFATVPWHQIVVLQELTGELITNSTMLEAKVKGSFSKELEKLLQANRRLLGELDDVSRAISVMPVSAIVGQFYRVVREISLSENKQVDFEIQGEDLQADRTLLDAISGPIIHLLRNAVDHGIEDAQLREAAGKSKTGHISLIIRNLGGVLQFTVTDDGLGIDRSSVYKKAHQLGLAPMPESSYSDEKIFQLIFEQGFSTTEVANRYSGRGMGMDVVRTTAETLGGIVRVDTQKGCGSSFIIEVPASITSSESLRVNIAEFTCFISSLQVMKIHPYDEAKRLIRRVSGKDWYGESEIIPVVDMFALFGCAQAKERRLIVCRGMSGDVALITGNIAGQQTTVEKPLPRVLIRDCRTKLGISGAAMTGDGSIGYVLNPEQLRQIYLRKEL